MPDKQSINILHLEDSQEDAELIKYELTKAGMNVKIKWVKNQHEFEKGLDEFQPDLILLDYTVPGFDGLAALRMIQKKSIDVPVIIVSGSLGEEKAVEVVKLGAVDYVLKNRLSRLAPVIKRALEEAEDKKARKKAEESLAESYEKIKRILEATVAALAILLEKRDPYTAGHQFRVTELSCRIGVELGFNEDRVEGLRIAGLLHDIGKISVPAEILTKPGRLTETEFLIIKDHPGVAYEVLKTIEFPWPIADFVYQHHERINGSGYPNKLTGDKIYLEARILGVADVVEAMSSHRPYRPALGIDAALQEIEKNKGILYDVQVSNVCIRLFREKGFRFKSI